MDKFFKLMDKVCEKANLFTGLTLRFPRPKKRGWKISAIANLFFALLFFFLALLTPYKWFFLLTLLGFVGFLFNIVISKKTID